MNEKVLGHFLTYKRTTLNPVDFGIKTTTHRRVKGLRRDEVADLAHVSSEWVTRLEQGRPGAKPSVDVLLALSRVLQLTSAEQQYLFNLIGAQLPPELTATTTISSNLIALMQQQLPNIAVILDQHFTMVNWNSAFSQVYGDLSGQSAIKRNLFWQTFKSPELRQLVTDWEPYASERTAQFRQLYSTMPDSEFLYQVFEAIKSDPVFQTTWQALTTRTFSSAPRLLTHPDLGQLYLTENVLQTVDQSVYLLVQTANDAATRQRLTDQLR